MFARAMPALTGMSFLISLVYLALTAYFFVMMHRIMKALEDIATALESMKPEEKQ